MIMFLCGDHEQKGHDRFDSTPSFLEFPYVFPKDFFGLPPTHDLKFTIELNVG